MDHQPFVDTGGEGDKKPIAGPLHRPLAVGLSECIAIVASAFSLALVLLIDLAIAPALVLLLLLRLLLLLPMLLLQGTNED